MPKRIDIKAALRRLAPRIPPHELGAVVDHALDSRGLRAARLAEGACFHRCPVNPLAIQGVRFDGRKHRTGRASALPFAVGRWPPKTWIVRIRF